MTQSGIVVRPGDDTSAIKFHGKDDTDTVHYSLSGALTTDRSLFLDLGSGGDGAVDFYFVEAMLKVAAPQTA